MSRPLVVDLDGTLLRSDLLVEAMLRYSLQEPLAAFRLPFWIMKGKASLKERLASCVTIEAAHLPYNQPVLDYLMKAKREHRQIVLATASHRVYADQIASHLALFDRVIATEGDTNLSSRAKREKLIDEFGERGFDYIGNSYDDVPVWAAADKAYLADPERGVRKRAARNGNVEQVFLSRSAFPHAWLKAMRPHQWLKNLLIFIPLLAAHQFFNAPVVFQALVAFACFSLAASSGYLFNDLLDLESDRHHPRKNRRPLASGDLSILAGIISVPLLAIVAITSSLLLMPPLFSAALVIYYLLSIIYSRFLKSLMGIDTIALASLYTIRIIAGAFACGLVPTFWLLAFSMFLFLSLAMVKRYTELFDARSKGETGQTKGRGYFPADLEIIANLGSASGYLSVLVLALYIQDARTVQMYHSHVVIWLACPILLFWISRIWMVTHRGAMHDDPVIFAMKDRTSLVTGALFALVFILATMF